MIFDRGERHGGGRKRKNRERRGVGRGGGSWRGDKDKVIHLKKGRKERIRIMKFFQTKIYKKQNLFLSLLSLNICL